MIALYLLVPKIIHKMKLVVGRFVLYYLPFRVGLSAFQGTVEHYGREVASLKPDLVSLQPIFGLMATLMLLALVNPRIIMKPLLGLLIMGIAIFASGHIPGVGLVHTIEKRAVIFIGVFFSTLLITYDLIDFLVGCYYWLKMDAWRWVKGIFSFGKTEPKTWKGEFQNTTQKGDALADYVCSIFKLMYGKAMTTTEMKAKGMIPAGPGDQGADVIVWIPNNRILAIQCKNYDAPIGNSAVQEIIGAKAYYKATDLAIVSPNGFTKRCIELATAQSKYYNIKLDLIDEEKLLSLARYSQRNKFISVAS